MSNPSDLFTDHDLLQRNGSSMPHTISPITVPIVPGPALHLVTDIPTMADYLINGYWAWSGYEGTTARQWIGSEITVNITGLTPSEQILAARALTLWQDVANLHFTYTTGGANITFNHDGTDTAETSSTHLWMNTRVITSATVDISSDFSPGVPGSNDSYMFQTYIHEIGHALGLGHQGPYNDSATYGTDNIYLNDTWQWSIMSYFSQNNFFGASYRHVMTPQMVDIYAIQEMYGANTATRLGDTTYGFHSNAGVVFDFTQYSLAPALTLYDSRGNDTLDCSFYADAQTINLTPGTWSSVGGLLDNVGIYLTTIIENAVGGSGSDQLIGNGVGNRLDGHAGSNTLTGGAGVDRFVFDTALLATFDTVTDFRPSVDKLMLGHHVFTALNPAGHALAATMFHEGARFTTAAQRIDYNPANGWLTYDSNGSAAGGHATHFMTLSAGLTMHNGDFFVIG